LGSNFIAPKYIQEMLNGKQIVRTENPASRKALYGIGVAGLGSSASLLFAMANSINPAILPVSIGLSSLVFGCFLLRLYEAQRFFIELGEGFISCFDRIDRFLISRTARFNDNGT